MGWKGEPAWQSPHLLGFSNYRTDSCPGCSTQGTPDRALLTSLLGHIDRQFFTVEVIRYLQEPAPGLIRGRQQSFIIPVVIRGKEHLPRGSRALVAGKTSRWTTYTLPGSSPGLKQMLTLNQVQGRLWIARVGEENLKTVRALQVDYPLPARYHDQIGWNAIY